MKRLLLVASLITVGGCVAPGYDYVRPQYSGAYGYDGPQDGYDGGYYSGGYYDDGGYYPDYYDGCCGPASLNIGFGYGYGYPGYYAWGGYPYGYYGYPGYTYYVYDSHHHHDGNNGHKPPPRATGNNHNSWNDRDHGDDIHDRYHRYGEPTYATPWNAQDEAAIPESPRMAPAATQPGRAEMPPMPSPGFMPHGAPAAAHSMDFPSASPHASAPDRGSAPQPGKSKTNRP